MATVPTLISGGVDQTDYIQSKTLVFKRNSLDYTLVDPATSPALDDIVFLDTPLWNGRVSTIESVPFRDASGDDHRYVRVTATNPLVNVSSTGPFGLSDTPNYTTTFPFKDLTVIRTIDTSVDPEVTTLRLTGIVYEPGLLPGHIIPVTVAVESLLGENVHVTEVSVNWLNSENPEYHLDLGKDNAQKPTLQDAFDQAGCGCPSFTCTPGTPDYTVKSLANGDVMALVFPNHMPGQSLTSDPGTSNSDAMYVYYGATYKLEYDVYHSPFSSALQASLAPVGGASYAGTRVDTGYADTACYLGPPTDVPYGTINWTSDYLQGGDPLGGYMVAALVEANCVVNDSYASSLSAHITWLSGPDPRFEGLADSPCEEGLPSPGQPVDEQEFTGDGSTVDYTTALPFMAGSLVILVDGVDWTDQITAQDGTLGTYTLAYAPPLGSAVQVRYGYPK